LNSLKLGWIDYSGEHRNKVMAVLDALSSPGALDELGIGLIRDRLADILFPGTSTIQTRAKYFFIVPYLLMELEKGSYKSSKELIEKLGIEELTLIEILNKQEVDGVIGARAGQKLKRKPSSIYWSGLRTFDMFKHNSLSLANYAKAVVSMKKNENSARSLRNEDNDDMNIGMAEYNGTFWSCLLPDSYWRESLEMELSYNEAAFFKGKITKSERAKDSLFAFLLTQDFDELEKIKDFDAIGTAFSLPDQIKENYMMAKRFSQFISGANIRYNVILSKGENEKAIQKWSEWMESSFVKNEFSSFPFREMNHDLGIHNLGLNKFLDQWQKAVVSRDESALDDLIKRREIDLKSKDRAKLHNTKVYHYKEGDWVGTDKLQYRFPNAKIILTDIMKGLVEPHA
jgi:DNA-binding Lrp family transcriptional regulator